MLEYAVRCMQLEDKNLGQLKNLHELYVLVLVHL